MAAPSEPVAAEPAPPPAICLQPASHSISAVQGRHAASPLLDQTVSVQGVVTLVQPGLGLYIESTGSTEADASRGLFIESPAASESAVAGDLFSASGQVAELGDASNSLTSLVELAEFGVCSQGHELPSTEMELAMSGAAREALEGMRVQFNQPMVVTDVYHLPKGRLGLSARAELPVPTQVAPAGKRAERQARNNLRGRIDIAFPPEAVEFTRTGAALEPFAAVFSRSGKYDVLLSEKQPTSKPIGATVPHRTADLPIRLVTANLGNFFNGDGTGGGFPAPRGAESLAEFELQWARVQNAVEILKPDVLAVQELENDGFGATSAAAQLIRVLNAGSGAKWTVVTTSQDKIGDDEIAVGLFYREDRLAAVGEPQLLQGAPFEDLSRVPLAQVLRDNSSGAEFLLAVAHLKSKGRCPEDSSDPNADQGDGQGCWNAARLQAAQAIYPWVESLASKHSQGRAMIVGDLNAYRMEDPIRFINQKGYTDVHAVRGSPSQYTYVYKGQVGTLDYAFASPALYPLVRMAEAWEVNAGWPAEPIASGPWAMQFSDHNPLVVDFKFSQAETSD